MMTLLQNAQLIANSLHLNAASVHLDGDIDWPQLLHHADGHSLTPLLYAAWREVGLLDQLPVEARDRLARAYTDNAERNSYIRRELLEIHTILSEADVPHLVLKGWPLVERLYTDSAQRVLYDHDFLVPAEQAEAGHRALRAAGFRPLPGKDEWIEKHLPPLWRNDGYHWDGYLFDPHYPRPVELHTRLWEQGWRGLQMEQLSNLWRRAQSATVAGVPMQLLSDEDTLVHLAVHFTGHLVEREARLNQLLDLARFMGQTTPDWEQIWVQAAQANVIRFVYASLYLAQQIFGAPLPPENIWHRFLAATPPGFRAWLARHGADDVLTADYRRREKGKDYHLTFIAAASARERLGIVRFALLPPLGQLMAKYNLRHRWLGPLFYPCYVAERVSTYGRNWLARRI
jgi:hypothetical protein